MKKQQKTLHITAEQNGFTQIPNNICRNTFLSDSAKALYIYLKSHSDNFNLSYESIANYLHKSIKTIQREINELKDNGFLVLKRKENKNTYHYELLNSPKLEHLNKDYTNENILNAFWQNIIDMNDIDYLCERKLITNKQYHEIIDKIYNIAKTKWLDED